MKKLLTHLAILSLLAVVAMPMIACTPEAETEIETDAGELEIEGEGAYADDVENLEESYEAAEEDIEEGAEELEGEVEEVVEPPPAG